VCFDNLFMRSRSAPFFYKQKNVSAAVFANLVHERVPPLMVNAILAPVLQPFDYSMQGSQEFGIDQEMAMDVKFLTERSSDTEDLRELYKVTLNPSVWDPSLIVGEGDTDQEIETNRKTKVQHTATVTAAAVDRMMSASMLLTNTFRVSLFEHIKTFITVAQKKLKQGEDMSAIWEKIYEFIMQKIPSYDKFQLSRALGYNNISDKDVECHIKLDRFAKRLEDIKRKGPETFGSVIGSAEASTAPSQTIITQLTCSTGLQEFLTSHDHPRGDKTLRSFKSYDDYDPGADGLADIAEPYDMRNDGPASSMGIIGAGEMHGEAQGILGTGAANRQNRFGIKRKTGGGAEASFATKVTWNPEWVDGKLKDRIAGCNRIFTNSLHRAVSMALLGCPITYPALSHFIQSNVVFPFNMIYSRPYMTYDMSTGVCMKVGHSTGETLIGHADFQLGDNVVQKLHYGNFTFYSKSVVYTQQNVYLAEDMFSTGYIGGSGSEFFSSYQDMEDYNNGVITRHKSLFAMIAPYTDVEYNNPIDITGRYSGDSAALNVDERQHFATAPFYTKLWNWGSQGQVPPGRSKFEQPDAAQNTVCFQGHQSMYNPATSMYDVVIKNTGHWGERVYPGCGKVRQGMSKELAAPNYNNIYGGGGSMTGMTM
jgi:hypothetical protein